MARQLTLIETGDRDWRLDPETREIGRQGLAQARAALEQARAAARERELAQDAA